MYSTFIFYGFLRLLKNTHYDYKIHIDQKIISNPENFELCLTCMCILFVVLRLNIFMKLHSDFGLFVELISKTMEDIVQFTTFFTFMLLAIACLFRVLGSDQTEDDW